jgi:formylglycine-generating enzyme required for sulfatase activity
VNRSMNKRCGIWGVWLAAMVLSWMSLPVATFADQQDVDAKEKAGTTAPPLAVAPFDAAAAKAHQEAWAKHLGVPVEVTNSIGMKLVLIPPGEFMMGSPASERWRSDKDTQYRVRISKPYYLAIYEVTVGQFRSFVETRSYRTTAESDGMGGFGMGTDGKWSRKPEYTWRSAGFSQAADHPVMNVSWNDAMAFIEWLSEKEGLLYRLPTEAEWEYACRAGTTTAFHHGDDPEGLAAVGNVADATAKANFPDWLEAIAAADGHVFTAPVGSFRANGFGLHDMHGNVVEWCADWYGEYPTTQVDDPTGPAIGSLRLCRGGGWASHWRDCRSANRRWNRPDYRHNAIGFRLAFSSVDQSGSESVPW